MQFIVSVDYWIIMLATTTFRSDLAGWSLANAILTYNRHQTASAS